MKELPQEPNQSPTQLYNPTGEDFTFIVADEENIQHDYSMPSGEIVTFPKFIADKGAVELADKIVWKRGLKMAYEHELKKALEEIYV